MTDAAVRAAANQFVSLFESYDSAPVRAKMLSRPKRDGSARRNESRAQPPVVRPTPKQVKRDYERQRVAEPLAPGFAPFRLLQLERGEEPVQTEEKPERVDPLPLR